MDFKPCCQPSGLPLCLLWGSWLVLCPNCSHGSKCLLDKKKRKILVVRGAQDHSVNTIVIAVLKQGWDLWGTDGPLFGLKSGVSGERKQNINLSPPWPHRFWGWEYPYVLGMLPALTSKMFWNRNNQAGVWQLLHRCFYWYLLTGGFAPAFAAVDVLDWGPEPMRLNVQYSKE